MRKLRCSGPEAAVDALLRDIEADFEAPAAYEGVRVRGSSRTQERCSSRYEAQALPALPEKIPVGQRSELLRLGEDINASGGLDALDEAIIQVVQMQPLTADWRARLLERIWFDIGRA